MCASSFQQCPSPAPWCVPTGDTERAPGIHGHAHQTTCTAGTYTGQLVPTNQYQSHAVHSTASPYSTVYCLEYSPPLSYVPCFGTICITLAKACSEQTSKRQRALRRNNPRTDTASASQAILHEPAGWLCINNQGAVHGCKTGGKTNCLVTFAHPCARGP